MPSMRWVGLDVHARETCAAALDQESGEVRTQPWCSAGSLVRSERAEETTHPWWLERRRIDRALWAVAMAVGMSPSDAIGQPLAALPDLLRQRQILVPVVRPRRPRSCRGRAPRTIRSTRHSTWTGGCRRCPTRMNSGDFVHPPERSGLIGWEIRDQGVTKV